MSLLILVTACQGYCIAEGGCVSDAGLQLATRAAREWLDRTGYNWKYFRKGVYKDGHERKDVVNYRVSAFPHRIKALERYIATWIEYPLPASSLDGSGDSEVPSWIELDRVLLGYVQILRSAPMHLLFCRPQRDNSQSFGVCIT
jgi:hypothetical protein